MEWIENTYGNILEEQGNTCCVSSYYETDRQMDRQSVTQTDRETLAEQSEIAVSMACIYDKHTKHAESNGRANSQVGREEKTEKRV